MTPTLPLIGRREWVRFPEWDVGRVRAKIDTGAKTSSIHGELLKVQRTEDGREIAIIEICPRVKRPREPVQVKAEFLGYKAVKASGEAARRRGAIRVIVRLGKVEKLVDFTLADRSKMLIPVLLGRNFLSGDFWVDVARKDLQES